MLKRLITASFILAAFAAVTYLGEPYFTGFVTLVVFVAAYEWNRLYKLRKPFAALGALITIALALSSIGHGVSLYFYPLYWVVAFFYLFFSSKVSEHAMFIAGILLVAGSLCSINYLFNNSPWLMASTLLLVVACDSGAYFFGRRIGRTKLAPKISPNKTREGAAAGFVVGMVAAICVAPYLPLSQLQWLSLAPIILIVGILGDLFESKMKRDAGVKDSGNILPGHGGVLDRVDAYLPTLTLVGAALQLLS